MTFEEAEEAIRKKLAKTVPKAQVQVVLPNFLAESTPEHWRNAPMPKAPYMIKPCQWLFVDASGTAPDQPIQDIILVEPSGNISLGPAYGRVKVDGLTLQEAEQAIKKQLLPVAPKLEISTTLAGWAEGGMTFLRGPRGIEQSSPHPAKQKIPISKPVEKKSQG